MTGQKRIFSLIAILTVVSIIIIGVTMTLLYNSAFEQQRARLTDTVKSQASLITAVARYDQHAASYLLDENPEYDPFDATLSQLREAYSIHNGIGETGEFTLARLEGDQIVFLMNHRNNELEKRQPVSLSSHKAEPMKRALRGESGTIVGPDYRGEQVLAAYEPVEALGLGIVAKIDLSEVRAPFIHAGLISGGIAILFIFIGVFLFFRIGNPMARDLIAKEAQLRNITTTIPGSVYQFVLHKDNSISMPYMSETIESMIGVKADIFMLDANKIYDFIHPDDHSDFRDSLMQSAQSMTPWNHDFRIITSDKRILWIKSNSNPNLRPDGSILWNGVLTDITERKQAEEANARLLRAIEQADETIVITDAEGTIQYVNPAFEKITGYTVEEAIGQNPRILKSNQHDEAFYKNMWEMLLSGKQWSGEIINKKKDGTIYTENAVISPVFDSNGEIVNYVAAKNDITEIKRLQKLESRAERLETAGTIAGQVAHDFNNLLAPLIAYPDFIRDELPKNHSTLKYLDQMEKAAEKIADINQDLLAMGRRGHYNQEVINLNTIVQQAVTELEPLPKTLAYELDLCEDLMDINGGGAQLHRVINNMLHNAQDAMQNIGQISIKTENYYVDDVSMIYDRVPKGEYVKLTITDTGCGIPDDIVQKIFDPFFTSKTTDKKRGSGLGMSVVDAVIKDHNGYIDLATKVGEGTSFYIYFPITRKARDKKHDIDIYGGNESLLIVDDDEMQRHVTSQILKKLGYQITSVESGEKAVELIKNRPFDLLVLDMIMPNGMDGTETYYKILEIFPNQKAIIVSGFSESGRVIEAQKMGIGIFVQKPLTTEAIASAVRNELDREKEIAVY